MAAKALRPKSAQKQTNTPADQPKTNQSSKRSPLTPFQEEMCDLAGDLILNGGNDTDLTRLVSACMGHSYRRRTTKLRSFQEDPSKEEKDIREYIGRWLSEWKQKISREWPDRPLSADPSDETAADKKVSVTERVRSKVREELKDYFEEFLDDASPEELRLLRDVFMSSQSIRGVDEEVPLATSFSMEIGENKEYLRVSYKHKELVMSYIDLLEKGESQNAA